MFAKPVVAGLLAAGCLGAAAVGGYVAVRQHAAEEVSVAVPPVTSQEDPAAQLEGPARPEAVAESEVALTPPDARREAAAEVPAPVASRPAPPAERGAPRRTARAEAPPKPARARAERPSPRPVPRTEPARSPDPEAQLPSSAAPIERAPEAAIPARAVEPLTDAARTLPSVPEPPPPAPPEFVEVTVPAASVIGLRIETSLSSERSRVEDRVDARVTRDVTVDGQVAIPAGSRVIGAVTLVERGGKIRERARLGVRFHTLVFADGLRMPIRTEAIHREGESPANSSSKKIGGAAVGGAILGAILGGGKGAAIGGAAGAAGGTAAAMAGDRQPATLPAGSMITIRLAEPMTLEVEK